MKEKILGLILPIITYSNTEEILTFINTKPKPLSLYIFSTCPAFQKFPIACACNGAEEFCTLTLSAATNFFGGCFSLE